MGPPKKATKSRRLRARKFELRRPRPCREKPYCHVWLSNWREAVTGEIYIRRLWNDGVVPGSFQSVSPEDQPHGQQEAQANGRLFS